MVKRSGAGASKAGVVGEAIATGGVAPRAAAGASSRNPRTPNGIPSFMTFLRGRAKAFYPGRRHRGAFFEANAPGHEANPTEWAGTRPKSSGAARVLQHN